MFDLLYIVAAGLGYLVYRQVTTPPPQVEASDDHLAPTPRVAYQNGNKLLLRPHINAVPTTAGVQLGHLGTPRVDMVDPASGIRYPLFTKDARTMMANLRS